MNEYQKQAMQFAKKYNVKLFVLGVEYGKHFPDDKQDRYIFEMMLQRGQKSYIFKFGQSIADGAKEPTMYDVLACMQKSDVGTFEDFCREFGYDFDSKSECKAVEKTYKAVCKEYKAMRRLFSDDELQEMSEIN
jgi:hypothetical protein